MACTLLVSELPGDCTKEELQVVFSTYGEVVSIQLQPPGADGLCSAIVAYEDEEAAEDAEEVLDGQYSIRQDSDRKIRVKQQISREVEAQQVTKPEPETEAPHREEEQPPREEQPSAPAASSEDPGTRSQRVWGESGTGEGFKLWVGSLPPDITQEELRIVFGTYGHVLKVHILPTWHKRGKSAFVVYSSQEAAEDAIEVLDEVYKIRLNSPWPMQVRKANTTAPVRSGGWSANGGYDGDGGDWRDSWWSGWEGESARRWGGSGGWGGGNWWSSWDGPQESSWSAARGKGGGKRYVMERQTPCTSCGCVVKVTFECCEDCHTWHRGQRERLPQPALTWDSAGSQQWQNGGARGSGGGRAAAPQPDAGPGSSNGAATALDEGSEETTRRVHVFSNLPGDICEEDLRYVFDVYGTVTGVQVKKDEANPGKAHAFIDFKDAFDAESSVITLDGKYEIRSGFGPLRVKFARVGAPLSAPY